MDTGDGAVEAVDGVGGANAGDVVEHPVEHADLGQTGYDGHNKLQFEQDSWGNLHVVAELEVGCKLQTLRRGDVAKCSEYHIGDGTTGEYDAADELADEVDAALLVRNGHDNADWDKEYRTDSECEQETVPGEIDRVVLDNEHTHSCHADTSEQIPRNRHIFVSSHQAVVDIFGRQKVLDIRLRIWTRSL